MAWISFGALPCRKKKTRLQLASCCWNGARRLTCFLSASVKEKTCNSVHKHTPLSKDTTDSVLWHREVGRAKDASVLPLINEWILSRNLTEELWITIPNNGRYCTTKRQNRDVSTDPTTVRYCMWNNKELRRVRTSVWLQFSHLTQTRIEYKSLIRQVTFRRNGKEWEMYKSKVQI